MLRLKEKKFHQNTDNNKDVGFETVVPFSKNWKGLKFMVKKFTILQY